MSIPGSASPLFFQTAAAAAAAGGPTRSLRFESADSSYLSRSQGSGNSRTFTYAFWIKAPVSGNWPCIIGADSSSNERAHLRWNGEKLQCYFVSGGNQILNLQTNRVFKDDAAWYHITLGFDSTQSSASDRAKLYVNGVRETSFEYSTYPSQNATVPIGSSSSTAVIGRRNYDGSNYINGYLADVFFIDGSQLEPTSFGLFDSNNVWQAKDPSGLTFGTNGYHLKFADNSTNAALGTDSSGNSNTFTVGNLDALGAVYYIGNPTGLDSYLPSGWTRTADPNDVLSNNNTGVLINQSGSLLFAIKPTSSSITIKWIVYDGTGTYNPTVSLNTSSSWNGTTVNPSVSGSGSTGSPAVGTYSVTSGTTYYVRTGLTGSNNPALVVYATNVTIEPVSTGGSSIDSMVDCPTNGDSADDTGAGGELSGNYCVFNSLDQRDGSLSQGNLKYDLGSGTKFVSGTMAVKSGKWYWEAKAVSGVTNGSVGGRFAISQTPTEQHGENGPFTLFWHATGGIRTAINGTITTRATGTSYADGDTLGLALDADSNIAYFYKNGSLAYTYNFSSLVSAGSEFLAPSCWNGSSGTPVWEYNFGQRTFTHSARTNHKCLCSANFSTPTVEDGRDEFDCKLWTGNSTDQRAITGYQFSPDLVWIKRRNATYGGIIMDTVRGLNSGHAGTLYSNVTNAEDTGATSSIRSFNSDGFNLGTDGGINYSGSTYVGWAWNSSTSNVTNTDGDITSTVRANQTAGFSIISYTGNGQIGRTIGHGLSAAPEMIWAKTRDSAIRWAVYHKAVGPGNTLVLNHGTTPTGGTGIWGNTDPTNSVYTVSNDGEANKSGDDYIAYAFTSVLGFSQIGSYEGLNSGSRRPFVYTHFRPRWILIKNYSLATDWEIYDAVRSPTNIMKHRLYANLTDAEYSSDNQISFFSNGFRIDSTTTGLNANSSNYLYAAFAENPFSANGGLAR